MLEKLILRNFQRWEYLEVEFGPEANCFIGPTDTGKSSVIRALRWIFFNLPRGEKSILRKGAKQVEAELYFDGHTLVRRRGGGTNEYVLDNQRFAALGTGIPEPISNLLNVSDANIQLQLDPPFWFQLSAGEVSRQLNSVVNLDLIDNVLADLASQLRKAKDSLVITKERLDTAKEKKQELTWVKQAHKDLQVLETIHQQHQQYAVKTHQLSQVLTEVQKIHTTLANGTGEISLLKTLTDLGNKILEYQQSCDNLDKLIGDIQRCQIKVLKANQEVLETRTEVEAVEVCPLCQQTVGGL